MQALHTLDDAVFERWGWVGLICRSPIRNHHDEVRPREPLSAPDPVIYERLEDFLPEASTDGRAASQPDIVHDVVDTTLVQVVLNYVAIDEVDFDTRAIRH